MTEVQNFDPQRPRKGVIEVEVVKISGGKQNFTLKDVSCDVDTRVISSRVVEDRKETKPGRFK